jgi:5-methylcytosine-specific restriction endonuclease McrA
MNVVTMVDNPMPDKLMRMHALWWWIDRWRKSTAYTDMTLEEQGAYRNLLDEAQLRGGPLPDNERILAKACGDATVWKRVRSKVMQRFRLTDDGWRNDTLDEVISSSLRRAEKQKRYRQGKNNPLVQAIIARDGAVCGICADAIDVLAAEIDHIVPLSKNGHPSDVRNLQLAHPRCNQKKGMTGCLRHQSLPPEPGHTQSNTQSNTQK